MRCVSAHRPPDFFFETLIHINNLQYMYRPMKFIVSASYVTIKLGLRTKAGGWARPTSYELVNNVIHVRKAVTMI